MADLNAAYAFVERMVPRQDAGGAVPLWHGWALRAAYLAGLDAGRAERLKEGNP